MFPENSEIPDELIVDASILFSFFNKLSTRRKVVKKLLDIGCNLISPEYMLDELIDNKSDIMKYAKITESEFNELFLELNNDLDTFKEESYKRFLAKANKLSPHGEDTKDDPYFALSLSLNKIPIWSDEPGFNKQSEIEIFTTENLGELLKLFKDDEEILKEESEKDSKEPISS